MQYKDIGFSHAQVVTIPLNRQTNSSYESFKNELLSNSLIENVTASGQRLGNNLHQTSVTYHGEGPARSLATSQVVVDPDFMDVYEIELVAGRNFQPGKADNGKAYIINESLAKELLADAGGDPSMESLLGRRFGFSGMDSVGQIVGIAKDFNFNSLHHKIETLCLFNQQDWGYGEVSIKINGLRAEEALAHIESVWTSLIPGREFEYQFLDDHFAELYRADSTVSLIVGMLTLLSILISCLGLFGLASFTTEQRIKEIGIRKVLGASVVMVVALLSKDLVKLVLVAIAIAIPVSWYAVNLWLENYAFRIAMEWWVFVTAGLIALMIAFMTVSFQSIKAALANPVESLKSE
jgi:putative ABC transport system permease protein